jgi:hypothetical protein
MCVFRLFLLDSGSIVNLSTINLSEPYYHFNICIGQKMGAKLQSQISMSFFLCTLSNSILAAVATVDKASSIHIVESKNHCRHNEQ